jgi:hypothetical protein
MKFLFRNSYGMMFLYTGMVIGYGLISIGSLKFSDEWLRSTLVGFVWASTILHFYFDGFIWKVREQSVRAGLGLNTVHEKHHSSLTTSGAITHALKWTPFIVLTGWLVFSELSGSVIPEQGGSVRQWPEGVERSRLRNILQSVPGDLRTRRQLVTLLLSEGRVPEAVKLLNEGLQLEPSWIEGYLILGETCYRGGQLDQALKYYQAALSVDAPKKRISLAHFGLGQIYLLQNNRDQARREFQEALRLNTDFQPAAEQLTILDATSTSRSANPQ